MNVQSIAAAVYRTGGGDPVRHVLRQLESRRVEVASALGGESLQVELVLLGPSPCLSTHQLVFGPEGGVARLRPDGALAMRFRAHVTLRGEGGEILDLVLGDLDVAQAVYRGVLSLHEPAADLAPRYPRLMAVVAAALVELANQVPDDSPPDETSGVD